MVIKKTFQAACISAAIGAALLFGACTSAPPEPGIPRENLPHSILVMPPINRTVDVRAPAVFLANSTRPLAEKGYYVIPVALSETTFRQNGIMAAEEAHVLDHNILRDIFGADAAMYIIINSFGPTFQLLRSVVQVSATASLVDLRTGQEIWNGRIFKEQGRGDVINAGGGNFVQQLLILVGQAAINQIVNVVWDPSERVAREAIHLSFAAIPYGPQHSRF